MVGFRSTPAGAAAGGDSQPGRKQHDSSDPTWSTGGQHADMESRILEEPRTQNRTRQGPQKEVTTSNPSVP